VLAPVRVPGLEELRAQAIRALDAEAERRILAWPASPASPTTMP
jgi:hypothetical protein